MKKRKIIISYLTVILLLILTVLFALTHGASNINYAQLTPKSLLILFNIRLPRIFSALIAGALLCVSGCFLQAGLRNPIADPGIIGVSAGANYFAVLATFLFPGLFQARLALGLCGSLLVFGLLLLFQKRLNPASLIIAGVALNAVILALQNVLAGEKELASLATSNWTTTSWLAGVGLLTLIIAVWLLPWANYLKLSDEELRSLGVPAALLRGVLVLLAILLAATATVSVGVIAFIAIIVPHIGRRLVGADYQQLLPFSLLSGAWLLLFTDSLGRILVLPNEIPASVILAIIGGPFLIYLLLRPGRVK